MESPSSSSIFDSETSASAVDAWRTNASFYSLSALLTTEERREDLFAVAIWLIMLVFALISNILIMIGILRNTSMRASTSYWFIISLAICDITMASISIIHLLPSTIYHYEYFTMRKEINITMMFLYNIFWYTGVLQLGMMAGNRFISIVYPMEYKHIFSRHRTLAIIGIGYLCGFAGSLPTFFECCNILWNPAGYVTEYVKPDSWYAYVDMSINSASLVIMIISYTVIIYKVRQSGRAMAKYQLTIRARQSALRNGESTLTGETMNGLHCNLDNGVNRISSVRPPRSQVSKKEMRLFIQFFIVSLVFLLTWTTWQWVPYLDGTKWISFGMTSLFFVNNSVNPTVYVLFNSQLRRELHFFFCSHRVVNDGKKRRTMIFKNNKNGTMDEENEESSKRSTTLVAGRCTDKTNVKVTASSTSSKPDYLVRTSICSTSSVTSSAAFTAVPAKQLLIEERDPRDYSDVSAL